MSGTGLHVNELRCRAWCDANEGPKDRTSNAVVEDEGGPLGVGVQKSASNQAVLLWLKRTWW